MPRKWLSSGIVWLIVAGAGVLLLVFLLGSGSQAKAMPVTTLLEQVKAGQISSLSVAPDNTTVTVQYFSGKQEVVYKEPNTSVLELMERAGIRSEDMPPVRVDPPGRFGDLSGMMGFLLPMAMVGGVVLLLVRFMRQPQAPTDNTNNAFSFGKSRARRFSSDRPRTTFNDVAGVEEAKQELQEVVEFLKFPEKFASLGARIPKGVLLVGPPGTGKTLMARAVAGEAGVPFFSISGSEFVEMFVGVGASRVRDLFDQAKRNSPCIVFVDEIDAVGRQRGAGLGGGHDEREQTLNQILVEMDGFDTNTNVIVMAATNRPDVLDPALLRPGRFDRQVLLDRPDAAGRLAILHVHSREKRLDPAVNLESLSRVTAGMSGADLENLLNEAAILAARRNKIVIGPDEVGEAVDRVVAGPQRRSRIIGEHEKAVTAYHEMGHALVAHMVPHADPVHKVSIVARGMMGGYTRLLPVEDRYLWTKSQFVDTLAFSLGGMAAEELVFGEKSSGAANDIERATELARRMVCQYGMSDKLGPMALGRQQENVFLGRDWGEQRNYSDEIAREIDEEVRQLLHEAHDRAGQILADHRSLLDSGSLLLIERETLEGDELLEALGGPRRIRPVHSPAASRPRPEPRPVPPNAHPLTAIELRDQSTGQTV